MKIEEDNLYIEELSTGKFAVYISGTLLGALTPEDWLKVAKRLEVLFSGY